MPRKVDILVVGAGFAGSVAARHLADNGFSVLVIDRRSHVAGNAFDELDGSGVLIHRYGPHIFHTNSERVFRWLGRFTEWRPYEHRVLAHVDGCLYPMPINRTTLSQFFKCNLTEEAVPRFLASIREPRDRITTSEDVVLDSVGRELCEKFFRGYTLKQWGLDLSELSPSVAARIPTRVDLDDRYFTDAFQFMPAGGYTALFEAMLSHQRIEVELGIDFRDVRDRLQPAHTVYTGPVDAYFDCRFGPLPYRSLRFEHEHVAGCSRYQPVGTVNYPNDHAYTRITEFKHLTGQKHAGTSIVREYPMAEGAPFYPVPRRANEVLYQRYKELAGRETNVSFVGRLAQYRYYNMDQVVAAALATADRIVARCDDRRLAS
jgi:UDP-galactopyranose mutase